MSRLTPKAVAPTLVTALLLTTILPSSDALPLGAPLEARVVPPIALDANEAELVGRWSRSTEEGREVFVFHDDRTATSWFEPRGDDHGVRTFVHWELLPPKVDGESELFLAEYIHDGLTNLIDSSWAPEAALGLHCDQLIRGDGKQFERVETALAQN